MCQEVRLASVERAFSQVWLHRHMDEGHSAVLASPLVGTDHCCPVDDTEPAI